MRVAGVQAVVALAAVLTAGGRELPRRPTRYLVLWCGGRRLRLLGVRSTRSPLADTLRRYGVDVEEHVYYTTVRGRRYTRFKLIVRDERLTAMLARIAGDEARLRRLLKRFENVVLDVLRAMGRVSGWRRILELVPRGRLMRWFGIKPFDRGTYLVWRDRAVVRLLKPNWRGWLYKQRMSWIESSWWPAPRFAP